MPARASARRRWRRQPARVWVRVPYPAWFFLNRVSRVWAAPLPDPLQIRIPPTDVCERIPTVRQRMSEKPLCSWAVEQLDGLDRTVATVLSEPLQLLGFIGRECPSRSAINSAPDSLSQIHQQKMFSLFL